MDDLVRCVEASLAQNTQVMGGPKDRDRRFGVSVGAYAQQRPLPSVEASAPRESRRVRVARALTADRSPEIGEPLP
jgi:hypothetical protein